MESWDQIGMYNEECIDRRGSLVEAYPSGTSGLSPEETLKGQDRPPEHATSSPPLAFSFRDPVFTQRSVPASSASPRIDI